MKRLVLLSLALLSCKEQSNERKLTEHGKKIVNHRSLQELDHSPAVAEPGEAEVPLPKPAPEPEPEVPKSPYLPITGKIHKLIESKGTSTSFEPYKETIPLADHATFEMLPIPEAGFWIGKHEVSWELYRAFMENGRPRNLDGSINRDGDPTTLEAPEIHDGETLADVVPQPPPPFRPQHFEMGEGYGPGWPAIAMSQHAASKFCEWLSAQTGHYYRLPTESEWRLACGDDPDELEDFAWTSNNSNYSYQKVGSKKPNDWGLHDMLGNVAEWCLPDNFRSTDFLVDGPPQQVARGGSYQDKIPSSSTRALATPAWNASDPANPKSIWYLSNNQWVGFRIVRPVEIPDLETMHASWNSHSETGD
ncbi:formylglycine-generating enzyme family protein [Haloferula chungangensis]|uniref:Formylglycine-generating enzyme family protein n=1 Tax=Haloferula chungangensis TaxID=1048331 RepID=A0ABW2L7C9_9BACT